tara:strand:+ start:182 stop:379 length:198 start_codon:yes stop_codon:yes gene_type:complete
MFYDIDKLNDLEKTVSDNLASADNHTQHNDHKTHWINYRTDMPNCLMVIREYKELLRQLNLRKEN